MKTAFQRTKRGESDAVYRNRFLLLLAVSQLFMLLIFTYWPAYSGSEPFIAAQAAEDEPLIIGVDLPERTRQQAGMSAPPKPVLPLPIPIDRVVEEVIELPEFRSDLTALPLPGPPGAGLPGEAGQGIVANPGRPASVLRIVEPIFPDEAKAAGIRAVIVVTFVVASDGQVSDVFVNEIRQYSKDGSYSVTNRIGYGLVEATLRAALQWKFRPARNDGKPVASYVRHEFSFGM